jgi:hypothetical protein
MKERDKEKSAVESGLAKAAQIQFFYALSFIEILRQVTPLRLDPVPCRLLRVFSSRLRALAALSVSRASALCALAALPPCGGG